MNLNVSFTRSKMSALKSSHIIDNEILHHLHPGSNNLAKWYAENRDSQYLVAKYKSIQTSLKQHTFIKMRALRKAFQPNPEKVFDTIEKLSTCYEPYSLQLILNNRYSLAANFFLDQNLTL